MTHIPEIPPLSPPRPRRRIWLWMASPLVLCFVILLSAVAVRAFQANRQAAIVAELCRHGGVVYYTDGSIVSDVLDGTNDGTDFSQFLKRLFGNDFLADVDGVSG